MPLVTYPVAADGNMRAYVSAWDRDIEWRENTPFTATLRVFDLTRGRSSIKYLFTDDSTGRQWEMFATDMLELLTSRTIDRGQIHGRWQVVKRGANYGLAAVTQPEPNEPA
ncbi:hypothetical protein [Nocardia terpenica]|uniref:Uncharacterized protein n=1 Tax=Nocardia terpenica TaxID=455432 RepID=A0A164LAA3_9NOCA|nr:hypothetical protein [Nocardia terpenica]KZM72183.1 hypothetical protein AWN90_36515 [Nocardia terpenica]NQE86675.1 hypothetical protein [Nocardia terpenica]